MSSSSESGAVPVIEILILVGLVAVGGAIYYNSRQKALPNPSPVVVQKKGADTSTKPTPPADPYAGWAVVSDSKYGVSIKVPAGWTRDLTDDANGFNLGVTTDDSSKSIGRVTILTQDIGHGTPGPLISQSKVTIAGQSADKTIWEGSKDRLVEYKFQKAGKFYKFELTAPATSAALFDQFDLMVKSFTLN